MSAPQLSRRVTLERRLTAPDGVGGQAGGWQALGTLWAEMTPRAGREGRGAGGTLARAGYRVTIRALPEGSASRPRVTDRLRLGGRVFEILAVQEADAAARYLVLTVEERAGA
ncbi:head-tail adaptor protein [Roseivivax sp.]